MNNLKKLALEATIRLSGVRKAKNINQRLLEVLKAGIKLDRDELKVEIAIARILEEVKFKDELLKEAQIEKLFIAKDKDFLAFFNKTAKTVKNGLDTSISHSNNNSSFHYNALYKHLELKQDASGKFSIVNRK